MKWNKATKKQQNAARKFSEHLGITASQCMKYLDECFQLLDKEITTQEFEAKTGHSIIQQETSQEPVATTIETVRHANNVHGQKSYERHIW
jgi:hypothetical protein